MAVDLWCLGVLAFELMTGRAPFYDISKKETMKKILNVPLNSHRSSKIVLFIQGPCPHQP
jgi:serine/threonine protein kinase